MPPELPPAEKISEKIAGTIGGLGSFMVHFAISRKIIPTNTPPWIKTALGFEFDSQLAGEPPGPGFMTGAVFAAIGGIPAKSLLGKFGKVGLESSTLGGLAAIGGGDFEDIAIAAGEKQTLELVMASGRVRLTAVDANGNKRSCKFNLWWSIYPVGDDGKPSKKRVSLKSGISQAFVLPPGRYKARGSCDPDLGTVIFDVDVGQQNDLTVKVVPKEK